MHDGCTGPAADGVLVLTKVRQMGFANMPLPAPLDISCAHCGAAFAMVTFESACPECGMIHAVTPCSATDPGRVRAAGIGC